MKDGGIFVVDKMVFFKLDNKRYFRVDSCFGFQIFIKVVNIFLGIQLFCDIICSGFDLVFFVLVFFVYLFYNIYVNEGIWFSGFVLY